MKIIQLKDVWEQYRIKFVRDKRVFWEHLWALENINLDIEKGETVAIIGENGAGKTTLLKVIAGMLCPDKGNIKVSGHVSCLMELGTGFHPELTGRENIFLNAELYGLSREETGKRFDRIAEFAGIGKFIDAIVKNYSQGMYMRLAFALAIHVDPDVLLIDDILAIGDEDAQRKCISKIFELKERGVAIAFVSHDMGLVRLLCQRAILLRKGRIIADGLTTDVVDTYLKGFETKKIPSFSEEKDLNPEAYIIAKGDFKLLCDCENRKIKIYYKDKEITRGSALYSGIAYDEKWLHPSDAFWIIKEYSPQKIVLSLKYPQACLTQVWDIGLNVDGNIFFSVSLELTQTTKLSSRDIRLELTDKYINWSTFYETGEFKGVKYINGISPVRLGSAKITKIKLVPEPQKDLCPLIFDFSASSPKQVASLYKLRYGNYENNVIQITQVVPSDKQILPEGSHAYFQGKIIFSNTASITEESIGNNKINSGDLDFIFEDGKARIFYRNRELTKGMGLYTALRSMGVWYDSYQAVWESKKISDNKIIAVGLWPYIPVKQIWQIEILDRYTVSWQIEMDIYDQFENLELEQINLMLTSLYKDWLVSEKIKGFFLEDFSESYDISAYRFWYGPVSGGLKASGNDLPSIDFIYSGDDKQIRAVIENSDSLHMARRIQYQRIYANKEDVFSKPIAFSGIIKIEPNE